MYERQTFLYYFRYLHNHLHKFHMDPEINDFTLGPSNNPAEFRLRSKLETDVLTCEFCGFSSKTRANHNVHLSTCKQKNILFPFPDLTEYGKTHRGSFWQLCFNDFHFSPPNKAGKGYADLRVLRVFIENFCFLIWEKSGKSRCANFCQLRFNDFWTELKLYLFCFFIYR